LIEPRMKWR